MFLSLDNLQCFVLGYVYLKFYAWVKHRKIKRIAGWLAIPFTLKEHVQKLLTTLEPDKPKYTNHIIYI